MIKITNVFGYLHRSLAGTPAGSEAFCGVIVQNRVEGIPTHTEARRDYDRVPDSRGGYPVP